MVFFIEFFCSKDNAQLFVVNKEVIDVARQDDGRVLVTPVQFVRSDGKESN